MRSISILGLFIQGFCSKQEEIYELLQRKQQEKIEELRNEIENKIHFLRERHKSSSGGKEKMATGIKLRNFLNPTKTNANAKINVGEISIQKEKHKSELLEKSLNTKSSNKSFHEPAEKQNSLIKEKPTERTLNKSINENSRSFTRVR